MTLPRSLRGCLPSAAAFPGRASSLPPHPSSCSLPQERRRSPGSNPGEFGVHDGADDLYDFTDFRIFVFHGERFEGIYSEKAAAEISRISWVMAACLARLYWRVRSSMRLPALSVAVFMATMRALCSEASDSRTSWKISCLR